LYFGRTTIIGWKKKKTLYDPFNIILKTNSFLASLVPTEIIHTTPNLSKPSI